MEQRWDGWCANTTSPACTCNLASYSFAHLPICYVFVFKRARRLLLFLPPPPTSAMPFKSTTFTGGSGARVHLSATNSSSGLSCPSFVLLGLATLLGVLVKFSAAIPEVAGVEGRRLRNWWYIFMWPILACFVLTVAGIGMFLLANVLIIRMVYPDFAIFEQNAAGVGTETSVWVESQTILWGAIGSVGVLAFALPCASVVIVTRGKNNNRKVASATA